MWIFGLKGIMLIWLRSFPLLLCILYASITKTPSVIISVEGRIVTSPSERPKTTLPTPAAAIATPPIPPTPAIPPIPSTKPTKTEGETIET